MLKTRLTDLLSIEYPVIQGGMALVSDATLAAAVSEGGGLGLIGSYGHDADWVRKEIAKAKALTDKPFGVNIAMLSPYAAQIAQVLCEEGVAVVATGAGNPGPYIPAWKEAGIKVLAVIPSASLALRMERAGADAVVAEGCESGGHIGELTTMALVPQVADAVKIPVVAAGGIADGRGLAAALMLGACGVQCGTRFLCAEECQISADYKEMVLGAKDTDTTVALRSTGHPVRLLKNKLTREVAQQEAEGTLEGYDSFDAMAKAIAGDKDYGSHMAGQIAGLVKAVQPAREIVREICAQAEALLSAARG